MAESKYGVKIANVQAAIMYEYSKGLRYKLEEVPAMMTNSLFLNFLRPYLKIENGETKDVVCLDFGFGTRDFEAHEANALKNVKRNEERLAELKNSNAKSDKIDEAKKYLDNSVAWLENIRSKKDSVKKMSRDDLREEIYSNGVKTTYKVRDKKHGCWREKTITYRYLYRSVGAAKQGKAIFINEKLWKVAHDFLYMGYELPKEGAKIVEWSAYIPLIASSIVDTIHLTPDEILIMNDVEKTVDENVLEVYLDDGNIKTRKVKKFPVPTILFDGQAIIDEKAFPKNHEGFILLRNYFFKACAFRGDIQRFYRDMLGDEYDNAVVKDAYGYEHRVKNIKLITTTNAIKIKKIGVKFEDWREAVINNGCTFGITKSAHPSKLGEFQRASYQMMNSMPLDQMSGVMETTERFIEELKNDDDAFLVHLNRTSNFMNTNQALLDIIKKNPAFMESKYFKNRRTAIISNFVRDVKAGRVLQNAVNSTIIGSPYAMLLHSIGKSVDDDPTLPKLDVGVSCYCKRFCQGEQLACFRSPYNSRNNMTYAVNNVHPLMIKYFGNLPDEVICFDTNTSAVQSRNNGAD